MRDYQNAKIYKLYSISNPDLIYYGSTTQRLCQRLAEHVRNYKIGKNGSSKSILETGDYQIKLVEHYPCNNNEELIKKEGEYIKNNNCVNFKIAGRNDKEYYIDNRENILIKRRERYLKNKEILLEKITCECGCQISKSCLNRHLKTNKHNNYNI